MEDNEVKIEEGVENKSEAVEEVPEVVEETPRKRGRRSNSVAEEKQVEVPKVRTKFNSGDRVKISQRVGQSLDGKILTRSQAYDYYRVIEEKDGVVRVCNTSGMTEYLFRTGVLIKV